MTKTKVWEFQSWYQVFWCNQNLARPQYLLIYAAGKALRQTKTQTAQCHPDTGGPTLSLCEDSNTLWTWGPQVAKHAGPLFHLGDKQELQKEPCLNGSASSGTAGRTSQCNPVQPPKYVWLSPGGKLSLKKMTFEVIASKPINSLR